MRVLMAKYFGSASFKALFDNGLTLLDGTSSRDDWVRGQCDSLVPYSGRPQLLRSDFVQNSNDSYWATNPASPVEGYSPMFGLERTAQGPRTRIGTYMLQNPTVAGYGETSPAGQDGKFSADDIAAVLHNNRTWYAEQFLTELRTRCAAIGAGTVNVPGGTPRSVASACSVLASWNGRYDLDSVGAHVYRVFIADYATKFATELTVPFNPNDPVGTPSTPRPMDPANLDDDPMLVSLAAGLNRLDSASVPYNATLGTVQVFQPTGGVPPYPGLTAVPLGPSFPWHGGNGSVDGAFNAISTVDSTVQEDTRLWRINCATVTRTGGLCSTPGLGWQIAYGTSWHFGLEFTADGPRALGLVSYSQSANPASPFFNDQQQRYSEKNMRQIPFSEAEIEAALLPGGEITITDD
jgi:acyl-homoserine-lactone acylase